MRPPNDNANLPGPLQGLHAAQNRNAAPVKFSDWLAAGRSQRLHLFKRICETERLGEPSTEHFIARRQLQRKPMQLFGGKRAVDAVAVMPATTACLKPLSMRRLDLLNKQLPQLIQVCAVAAEHNAFRLAEETINHLHEVVRLNSGVCVPVGQAKEVKRTNSHRPANACPDANRQ